MQSLLLLSLAMPLLLAFLLNSRLRPAALILTPAAALPALVLSAYPGLVIEIPWLLLGMRLGVDETGALFLLLAGLLWTAAGLYAHGYMAQDRERVRFYFCYLLTLTGNLGVMLALDAASFYLFFALMSFSSYGLIVHDRTEEAYRAGRIYIVLVVIGEALLITALLLIAEALDNPDLRHLGAALAVLPQRDLILGLVLVGFGIKMGAVPLHVWLPLAHPAAPVPASAMLSGIIIKAGLLGWLRFLPLGEVELPDWGTLCLAVGICSAFYAVLMGLPQVRPKTVLAYSSISQMGLVTVLIGISLAAPPEDWPELLATLLLFSLHHGLAKATLFLGVGVAAKSGRWAGWGLALPALALAGAPLTSGAPAKLQLKDAAYLAPGFWVDWLEVLLALSSLATALLMARFLFLAWPNGQPGRVSAWLWLPWLALLIAVLVLPWWWAHGRFPEAIVLAFTPDPLVGSLWPVVGAAILALTAWGSWRAEAWPRSPHVPEGDILQLFSWLATRLPRPHIDIIAALKAAMALIPMRSERAERALQQGERRLRTGGVAGIVLLLLMGLLIALLWGGGESLRIAGHQPKTDAQGQNGPRCGPNILGCDGIIIEYNGLARHGH